ncbi:HHR244Cp [Eremothecium sinecaudum]|uniref:HHR244Cp n=1 Tax=Eremothecium sinecaudum TaxID=45286 RepID=A0A109V0X9_9SACH|nr:HHR244Cp [Eremothecium sinecaudum]AMD23013.1 HHR244Cp [Eremothecium sinecaudum]
MGKASRVPARVWKSVCDKPLVNRKELSHLNNGDTTRLPLRSFVRNLGGNSKVYKRIKKDENHHEFRIRNVLDQSSGTLKSSEQCYSISELITTAVIDRKRRLAPAISTVQRKGIAVLPVTLQSVIFRFDTECKLRRHITPREIICGDRSLGNSSEEILSIGPVYSNKRLKMLKLDTGRTILISPDMCNTGMIHSGNRIKIDNSLTFELYEGVYWCLRWFKV